MLLGGVALPLHDFARHPQPRLAAVGLGWIAGELAVSQVGVVFDGAGGLHDVDAAAVLAHGQLSAPDRGFQRRGQIDVVRLLALAVVGHVARLDQVTGLQVGLGAVVIRWRAWSVGACHRAVRGEGATVSMTEAIS
ncbi:hypothetical protein ASC91_05775 [Pelomonas sp. Root1237]|nr:hypothetical protein ASC91_05775 [Pelomonas sp. Root1237]